MHKPLEKHCPNGNNKQDRYKEFGGGGQGRAKYFKLNTKHNAFMQVT